jgi:hypothetical protein
MIVHLFIGNDQTIELEGLRDIEAEAGEFINDATVTARIRDRLGVDVGGESWPIALNYVADSNGNYEGNFDDSIQLAEHGRYLIDLAVNAGSDLIGFWRQEAVAKYRSFGQ